MLPSDHRISPKITQQKDARIRVLLEVRFCHRFPDVAKEPADLYFHVGELEKRGRLTIGGQGSPTENTSIYCGGSLTEPVSPDYIQGGLVQI